MTDPLREPNDSYDFPTVPRYAVLGKEENPDADTTLGDRFFDLMNHQDKSTKKEVRCGEHAEVNVQGVSSPENDNMDDGETPFGMKNLAMFRPPSRTNVSSDQPVNKDSNNSIAEGKKRMPLTTLKINGKNCEKPRAAARTMEVAKPAHCVDPKPPQRVLRNRSAERCLYKAPEVVKRSASTEPKRNRSSFKVSARVDSNLLAARAVAKAEVSQQKGPVRVMPTNLAKEATPGPTSCAVGKSLSSGKQNAPNIKKPVQKTTLTSRNRTERYCGPETRARAKMRVGMRSLKSDNNLCVLDNDNPALAEGQSAGRTKTKERSKEDKKEDKSEKKAEGEHLSRPRTRLAVTGPIRVLRSSGDRLPPLKSADAFQRSLERRPKGGSSLERKPSNAKNARPMQPKMEFAPCLRRQAAAMGSPKPQHQSDRQNAILAACKKNATIAPQRRRTAAERDAFFRRLSTPKKVVGKVPNH